MVAEPLASSREIVKPNLIAARIVPNTLRGTGVIELTLGRDFLQEVSASAAADVTGSTENDGTEPTTPSTQASSADG